MPRGGHDQSSRFRRVHANLQNIQQASLGVQQTGFLVATGSRKIPRQLAIQKVQGPPAGNLQESPIGSFGVGREVPAHTSVGRH